LKTSPTCSTNLSDFCPNCTIFRLVTLAVSVFNKALLCSCIILCPNLIEFILYMSLKCERTSVCNFHRPNMWNIKLYKLCTPYPHRIFFKHIVEHYLNVFVSFICNLMASCHLLSYVVLNQRCGKGKIVACFKVLSVISCKELKITMKFLADRKVVHGLEGNSTKS
jgi:hypothetical protein